MTTLDELVGSAPVADGFLVLWVACSFFVFMLIMFAIAVREYDDCVVIDK